nr:hypothetical protein [Tanacetum cinerariifolium]
MTHPHSNRNVVPTTVLTRSRLVSLNAARPVPAVVTQSTVKSPRPVKHVVNKAHSPIRRPINHIPATKNSNFNKKVTTVKVNKVNVVQGTKDPSQSWLGSPKDTKLLIDVQGNPQQALKDKGVIDNGCSRHMTGNMSFLSYFKEISRGYVTFGGNPKGGKISGKGKINTGKLDFDDVYFVKELKFNVFSVSQICDKKNSALFTDTECVVLSSDYKLPDENHVLLRVLRENNMYNVDLKNVVLSGELTCLFAKATLDEKESNIEPLASPNLSFLSATHYKDPLGKFDGKADKGFLVGYSINSKAFRVFNSRTRIVQETLHINFLENKPNVARIGPKWLFDIDTLTKSVNYQPVVAGNQPNDNAGIKENFDSDADVAFDVKENENDVYVSANGSDKTDNKKHDKKAKRDDKGQSPVDSPTGVRDLRAEFKEFSSNSTNRVNAVNAPVNATRPNSTNSTNNFNTANNEEDVGAEADFSNLETNISVSSIPITKVYKDHPVTQIIGDLTLAPQTRSMIRMVKEQGGLNQINDEDFYTCMFACFLYQEEPKKVNQALKDPSWIEAIQEELLQFKMQKVWVLVDLPKGKRAIGLKWVFWNKKDERGIVIKNKARLVAHGHTQEEGIDYDEVFAHVARFEDPDYPDKVYKVVKAFYGLHQAPGASLVNTVEGFTIKDVISRDLYFDDADGVECLPTEEIFVELALMGYEKPPPKLTFYKAFFSAHWKFLIHTLTSTALTQKVFANIRRVGKGFLGVETPLFALMLVQPQPQAEEEEEVEVAELEQDKHTQALEILKLKKRVKKLEKKKRSMSLWFQRLRKVGGKIEAINADKGITLVDAEKDEEVVTMDAEPQGRIDQEDVNAASKGVSAAERTVFNDEEVTMTMAQTLIKLKAEKAKFLDEQIAQKLHDEEVQKATARDKQENDDLERAQVLQKQYDDKEENIDWNAVAEQVHEMHLDNIRLGMTYDNVRPIFEREYKKVQTLFKLDKDVEEPKKKRVTDETLLQESFKKLRAAEMSLPSVDKQKALWVELKILFKPDADDVSWKLQRVGHFSGKDSLAIVVADTDCLPHACCGSALSACVLKHLGRSQLIPGLSGSSKSSDDSYNYYWEYAPVKAKGNILGLDIIRDQSGNTLRVSQSRFYNEKLLQTLLEGHSIVSSKGSLSGDCDVKKNESRYELRLVACIATGALVKGGSRSEVPAQVKVAAYRY